MPTFMAWRACMAVIRPVSPCQPQWSGETQAAKAWLQKCLPCASLIADVYLDDVGDAVVTVIARIDGEQQRRKE
jgi:hypothetical protein